MTKDFLGMYNSIRLILSGAITLLVAFEGLAQDSESYPAVLPIGVTHATVNRAAVVRYGYFRYTSYHSSSHSQNQAFSVAQPKFALPSANLTRPMAFNSRTTDVILSNVGVLVGGILGGVNYRQPKSSYNDKYSLRVGAKP